MKKFLTRVFAAVMCAGVMLSTAMSVSAENYIVDPQYPIHGNDCGVVRISPEIDRDIAVAIAQITQDGDYVYYDTVIPAGGENTGEDMYDFVLEGKNDVTYRISLGVAKYKGSTDYQYIEYDFAIPDTDEIVDGSITTYLQGFTITRDDELETPALVYEDEEYYVEEYLNVAWRECRISFPASDIVPGDVDFNEVIDLYDVIAIARYIADPTSLNEAQIEAADYNSDGITNLYDAVDLAKHIMGM